MTRHSDGKSSKKVERAAGYIYGNLNMSREEGKQLGKKGSQVCCGGKTGQVEAEKTHERNL